VKKKIEKIIEIIFSESEKPKTFWISIPEYFPNENERHKFIQKTINFVNHKTKTINKRTYA
jgi:hypothetical protein